VAISREEAYSKLRTYADLVTYNETLARAERAVFDARRGANEDRKVLIRLRSKVQGELDEMFDELARLMCSSDQ
jgi:hypothetical protein